MKKNKYSYQAKATRAFGVTFRSKLEAMWAYEYARGKQEWEYVDASWFDFRVGGVPVEIKPQIAEFVEDAISRAWPHRSEWTPVGEKLGCFLIVLGEPDVARTFLVERLKCDACAAFSDVTETQKAIYFWDSSCGVYGHQCLPQGCVHVYPGKIPSCMRPHA